MNNKCPCCDNPRSRSLQYPTNPSIWSKTCGNKDCIVSVRKSTNLEKYGHICNLHSKLENGNTILQETISTKYGVTNVSQIDVVKVKKQDTCTKNFGVPWPMQSKVVRDKSIDTNLIKYGYDNVSKHPDIINKIKQTQIDRYGALYVQTDEGKAAIIAACQEKYGVDYYFSSTDFKQKLEKRCMELFGVTNPFFSPTVQAEIAKRNQKGISMEETKWLDSLSIPISNRQINIKGISGTNYIVDAFDPVTNTVYEWNGSFWHGNPDYYDSQEFHPVIKTKTFGDLYEKTIKKQEDILNSGYNLIVKWSTI